jgi:hypothetical protein
MVGAVSFRTVEINVHRHAILVLPDVIKRTECVTTEAVRSGDGVKNVHIPVIHRHIITVRAGTVVNLMDCVTPVNLVDMDRHVDHFALTHDTVPLETAGRTMVNVTDVCPVGRG